MHHGVALPTGGECGDPRFLVEPGLLAEAAGWDGVFLEDHVCYQGDRESPGSGKRSPSDSGAASSCAMTRRKRAA